MEGRFFPGGAKAHLGGGRVEVVDDVLRVVQPLVAKRASQGAEKEEKEGEKGVRRGPKKKKKEGCAEGRI